MSGRPTEKTNQKEIQRCVCANLEELLQRDRDEWEKRQTLEHG
jgi:hypothetical protein